MFKYVLLLSLLTTAAWGGKVESLKAKYLKMSDEQLWTRSLKEGIGGDGKGTGGCYVADQTHLNNWCSYYVRARKGLKAFNISTAGLPGVMSDGLRDTFSNGCVFSPMLEKSGGCFNDKGGQGNQYSSYDKTFPICTKDHVKNATNMIRIALSAPNDLCDLGMEP